MQGYNNYPPNAPQTPPPPNYLVWAILVTILCCLPFGIVAIVYSGKVNGLWYSGNYEAAFDASRKAKMWSIASAVCGLVAGVAYAVVMYFSFSTDWASLAG